MDDPQADFLQCEKMVSVHWGTTEMKVRNPDHPEGTRLIVGCNKGSSIDSHSRYFFIAVATV